jgi:hypothetical protein
VEEKIGRQTWRKLLHLDLEALRGTPDKPGMVKDVVSGGGLQSLETNGFVELGSSKTFFVRVTESNQRGRGGMMGRPLEF